jgi:energy coupling factor transporter S component ThiW
MEGNLMKQSLIKLIMISMFVAIGVVISPILRFEGFAPTAHLVNVVVAVFMGPWAALINGILTAIIRMTVLGIPPLAITGQVFGALCAGLFYKISREKLICATIGEIIGTGIIGSILSYPVMRFIMGRGDLWLFFYTPSFIIASTIGATVAYLLLKVLSKSGILKRIQTEVNFGGNKHELQKKS